MSLINGHDKVMLFFLVCFLCSIFFMGWLLWPFISIIIIAAVFTGIVNPLYRLLVEKGRLRKSIASLFICILIFFVLFVPIVYFVGILSKEAYDLYLTARDAVLGEQIQKMLEESALLDRINGFLVNFNMELSAVELNQAISEVAKIMGLFLYNQARLIASNMLSFLVNFFLMLLVIFYLLLDGKRLLNFIVDLSPLPDDQDWHLINKFKEMAGAILIGNGMGGFIQGTLGGVAFSAFGLNAPFLWGAIMGLLAFLPIIGIGLVFIPTAILFFIKKKVFAGFFFLVFYVILSFGTEYLFKPKLVGKQVRMHTLLVFFAIIGGLKLFGILGIIYGPLVVTAFLTLTDIYQQSYQEPLDSELDLNPTE